MDAEQCLDKLHSTLTDTTIEQDIHTLTDYLKETVTITREKCLEQVGPILEKLDGFAYTCMDQKLYSEFCKKHQIDVQKKGFFMSVGSLYFKFFELAESLKKDKFDPAFYRFNYVHKMEDDPTYKKQISLVKDIQRYIDVSILPKSELFTIGKKGDNKRKRSNSFFGKIKKGKD